MDFQTRYEFNPKTDLLGKGGFSKVYRAHDILFDRTVALKFFTGNGGEKYQVLNEIKKVIRFEHPNLCKYYDVAVLTSKNIVGEMETIEVGIMEYLDAGNIKTYLKNNPQHTDKLLMDVLKGLSYLHKKGIVHRDLKPQNIIIKIEDDEPVAKITDFGISKLISADDNNSSALIGTIEYMAPEQFNPKKYGIGGRIATNLDIWSFGLLVYEALQHKPLFGSRSSGTSAEQVMRNILSESYLTRANVLSPKYLAIVKRCLVKYASKRAQNALELIPLFNETVFLPGEVATTNIPDPGGNGLNKNNKKEETLQETNIKEASLKEENLDEEDENTQVVDSDPELIYENTSLLEVTEDGDEELPPVAQADNAVTPGEGIQVLTIKDSVGEDQTQLHQFTKDILQEPIEAEQAIQGDVNESTHVLEAEENLTGQNTEIHPSREELADEFAQISGLEKDEEKDNATGVIQWLENVEDNNTSVIADPNILPGKDVFQPVLTKIEKQLSTFQNLVERLRLLASQRDKSGKLVLYSIVPLLLIIGFFVFWQINSISKNTHPKPPPFSANDSTRHPSRPPVVTELVSVAGGSFIMGSENPPASSVDSLAHRITINNFLIGKYEVTIDEFRKFINDTRYLTTAEIQGTSFIYTKGTWDTEQNVNWRYDINGNILDTHIKDIPVVHVSWRDANRYCEWLSDRNHKHYRLPTEAEWEFAARGGNNSKNYIFSGSNTLDEVAWFQGNSGNKIQSVGQKKPNELGIYDMSGNVMEWCDDLFEVNNSKVGTTGNPQAPDSVNSTRVVRGGSWFMGERKWFRNSFRVGYRQNITGGQLGFRICEQL